MKRAQLTGAIVFIILATAFFAISSISHTTTDIEVFKPSTITLNPNLYIEAEKLEARRNDISLREVTFQWAFEERDHTLPAYSTSIVEMQNVATLIDSVAAIHMAPRIHAESGQPERRLVGVTVGEPALIKDIYYGVETLSWVPTMIWHRN